jgi:TonB-linked SusC/RagA family outer membrane protein
MNLIACRRALPCHARKRGWILTAPLIKFMVVFLLLNCLQLATKLDAQNLVTLSLKRASMETALKEIKKQSGYSIFYDDELLKKSSPVTVNVRNASIEQVMTLVFADQPLTYQIVSKNQIVIKAKEQKKAVASRELPDVPSIDIKGNVVDKNGQPVEGVSVSVQSGKSSVSTQTDAGGDFSIRSDKDTGTLVLTHISYETQRLSLSKAGKLTGLIIRLKELATDLDDVVIIGYGQVSRRDVTGAVGKADMKSVEKAPVRSFEEALGGRLAGVQVTSADGQPGSAINIVIRGQNSITQSNAPLYVVDGFPLEDPENNAINPDDIESIEVLKDASATAIYGARGANGVIMITTKRGKEGPAVIRYNGYYGAQKIIKTMELMDPYEFVKYELERQPNTAANLYLTNGKTLEDYRNAEGVNWQDELFRTASMQSHTLSVSGGTKSTKYTFTGSMLDQKGILINSGYRRAQFRLALDQTISKNLKIGVNVNYSWLKKYGGSPIPNDGAQFTSGLMYSILGYRPVTGNDITDLANEEVDPELDLTLDYRYNPKLTAENEVRNNIGTVSFINGYAEQTISKSLKLRVTAGITMNNRRFEEFNNSKTRFGSPNTPQGLSRGINGSLYSTEDINYLNENTLTYNKSFGTKHRLNVVTGFTMQSIRLKGHGAAAQQLPNESLGLAGLDEGIPITINSVDTRSALASFLGRANYTFMRKYLFTASFRADGSSRFATQNKWSYFPSGAFAWQMGKEDFMKGLTFVSDAKVRATYGVTGNNRVSDFAYLSTITFPTSAIYPFNNSLANQGASAAVIGNPNLKWESTRQLDLGVDLSLFNGNINLEAGYYRKVTSDLLLNAAIPTSLGYDNAFKNIGKVENKGWEFTLNTNNIKTKTFNWTTSFNISFNKNRVLELTQNQETLLTNVNWDVNYRNIPLYIAKLDKPIALFYGYIWEGNYQYEDFDKVGSAYVLKGTVPTNGNDRLAIQPGDIKYRDINQDGVVDVNDMTVIGNPNPDFTGGFNNNFSYGNFDLNIFFQFSYGNEAFNANRLIFEGSGRVQTNMLATYKDRWTPENQSNRYFRTNGQGPYAYSNRVVEDASFLRLKTVSLGYNFTPRLLRRIGLKSARVYASAQNLLTWTKYEGFDPEVSGKNSALTPAFDYSVYPRAKTIIGGINITL